jgi:cysteinyl-tRNA synthetase
MSKSLGNFYTLRDLIGQGFDPMAIRYALMSVPYRKQLNFTFDGLRAAENTLRSLRDFRWALKQAQCEPGANAVIAAAVKKAQDDFEAGMDDDLNTAQALAAIHTLVRDVNIILAQGELRDDDRHAVLQSLDRFDTVLGVLGEEQVGMLDNEIEALLEERVQARAARNFARSDEIRDLLTARGIILEDTKQGTRWKRK